MLDIRSVPYALAVATPRDTRDLAPAIPSEAPAGEPRRRDWLAGRLAAKRAATRLQVAGHTATHVFSLELDLSISLSHTDGHAIAAAIRQPARIGVDLEREDRIAPGHASYFLSPRELRQHAGRSLTELWVLKESAWKALGCGDSTPFTDLELIAGVDGGIRAVRLGAMVFPAAVEVYHPWRGWVAAVVVVQGIAA